ncbi:MAG: aminotransferase class V-fold PLP-dependent enzyme [Clostridia bacterium]|nr:aminotransferase class V-fold PLP-dependent enzyme [Clostridia bacterium]
MIYLDNAATTFPKPREVTEEVRRCITRYCGNPGRGSHRLAMAAAERIYECRELLSDFLGVGAPERIVFTLNTTHGLNLAIKGALKRGDHVLISELEHNAVRRPLFAMQQNAGVTVDVFPVLGLSKTALLEGIRARCTPSTRAVICTHASNICSVTLPIAAIGALCRERGWLFVVDGAQSAGHLPLDMTAMHIDGLALPAHKGLYGIQGAGVLALSEALLPAPLLEGGSGVDSRLPTMPELPPERYEAGTLATPAIVALAEGVRSLQGGEAERIAQLEKSLFAAAKDRLLSLPDIEIYEGDTPGGVLLFNRKDTPSTELGQTLSEAGICVRAGLHCAPMAHRALGTPENGAVRLSFGRYNTVAQLDALWKALRK